MQMIQDCISPEALELFQKQQNRALQAMDEIFTKPKINASEVAAADLADKLTDKLRAKLDQDAETKEREAWERAHSVRA